MVARYDDLVPVRETPEPSELRLELLEGAAVCEVAGVQEEVSVGDGGLGVMCV